MPRTRADVYKESNMPLSEEQLQKIIEAFQSRFTRLNDQYLRMMGQHIRDIGQMWPSDIHRLQQIRRMNNNLKSLERRIAIAANASVRDIEEIFNRCAASDVRMATKILGLPDSTTIKGNPYLERILEAQKRETGGAMRNLSNTTVVSQFYRNAVDEAVQAVQSGVEDYNTAIRRVVREAGCNGLRVTDNGTAKVDYESGYSRRLDSAARMNVLDGVRHMNQNIMNALGQQFGADGVEIDAHMLCAEDHLPYQGQQFSNEEFNEIQDGLQRPFGEWNCRHSWHPILLGISPRLYSDDQLDEMKTYSREPITIDGRTKTRYQWSQEMRRIETAVRQQKDTANLARSTGDKALQQRCQGTILRLNDQYRQVSAESGLKTEFGRTYTAGFRDVGSTDALTNTRNSGNIVNEKEMFRKAKDSERDGFHFISDTRFEQLVASARNNGATVIRGDPVWEKHLIDNDAAASTIGSIMVFREKIAASEVIEEVRHFEQNISQMNDDKPSDLRMILNEIEAREFIIANKDKYKLPRIEIEFAKKQCEDLKKQLDDWYAKEDGYVYGNR